MFEANLPPLSSSTQPTVHHAGVSRLWRAVIEAEAGTLMLPRLLQKLVCQGAEIQTLHYRRDDGVHTARVELHFQAEPARARLLVRKWETVLGLHRVDLEAGDSSGTCVRPAGQIPGGR